jgi:hypothetical protein
MGTIAKSEPRKRKRKTVKKPKRTHICFAVLPNGVRASRVTSHKYKAALCVPQIGKGGLWAVLRWSKSKKLLQAEANRRKEQSHGERVAVVVSVETVTE